MAASDKSRPAQALDALDAVVVGAGFTGLCVLHRLRQRGLRVKILEAGDSIGGAWHQNRYPGVRVDCDLPYYGFSDPALWTTFDWAEKFPSGDELRRYVSHVDKVWDLSRDIILNQTVAGAQFDEDRRQWHVRTQSGLRVSCTYFVPATGALYKPHIPKWPDMESFQGPMHHSSAWPHQGIDARGKRVAVIGAGSSAIQLVQELGKQAASLTQFIRTPNMALPMRQAAMSAHDFARTRDQAHEMFEQMKETPTGMPFAPRMRRTLDDTPEEREAIWNHNWSTGGAEWAGGSYADITTDPEANRMAYDFWLRKTRPRITDPIKRAMLAPSRPAYFIGTKRPSLEIDYYETISRDSVTIQNAPIKGFAPTGIQTVKGLHEFDVIAIATGFDALTGSLLHMDITGRDGEALAQHWRDGTRTYLGLLVHNFPNMFTPSGPQAPTSWAAGPTFAELQADWIAAVIDKQRAQDVAVVAATAAAEHEWAGLCARLAAPTLLMKTDTWWNGANVPGKRREMLLFAGGVPAYRDRCDEALHAWAGLEDDKAA